MTINISLLNQSDRTYVELFVFKKKLILIKINHHSNRKKLEKNKQRIR